MIYEMTLLQSLNVFYAPKKCFCLITTPFILFEAILYVIISTS